MPKILADIGEFGLIHRIRALLETEGARSRDVILGLGDDAAAFRVHEGYELLVTCDSLVEGRHFLKEYTSAMDLGRRAMVINISDIGAMGGKPLYAVVSLGLMVDTPVRYVEEMYRGFIQELNPFGASVIGGNITKSEHGMFIDITLIGEAEKGRIIRRSTARLGDAILVTGYPGQAAAGLGLLLNNEERRDLLDHPLVRAYNRPVHRAKEGRAIAQSGCATSMIDISDGFLGDLGHICEESNVGAELFQEKLPVSEYVKEATSRLGKPLYDLVMGDSDDYELIITCAPKNVDRIMRLIASLGDTPVTEVGRIIHVSERMRLILPDGTQQNIVPAGWDHFIC
jgi:thiamine-monophosphate kinase